MQEEVKHYKVKSLGTTLRPNSVYYVKPNSQTAVLTYITDQTGVPYPLIDLTGVGNIQTVTGTGVTGTLTNPIVDISTFNSSQLGNLIQLSSTDGKLFVKPITSPDGSISIVNTLSELQIEVSEALQAQIQSALQPGDNVSELTNDAGYMTSEDITTPTFQEVLNFNNSLVAALNFQGTYAGKFNTGLESVNALGIFSSMYNAGSNINSFGASSALYNTRDNVNAFGRGAGRNNNFFSVNLFGQEAEADDNNQTVFSKFVSSISQFLARISYKNITANRKYELPDASGTIALTSDIPPTITIDANPTDGSSNAVSSNGVFDALAGKEPTITAGTTSQYWRGDKTWQTFPTIPTVGTWGALNYPTWTTGTPFVKMTAAGTFDLDTTTYYPYPTGTISQYIRGDGTLDTFPTIPSLTGYVPYTGATQDVDLGTHNLTADHIALNVNPSGAGFVEGATQWNNTIGSSETLLKGGNVTLKNGVDLVARVVNKVVPNTTLTKAAYQVVRISGAQGQRLAVDLAQANNDLNSADTLGIVTETIATNQEGFIITVGQLEGINTTGSLQGETWADGDVLYLSPTTAGRLTNIKPVAPGHIVIIGYVEYTHASQGKIYVKIMNGWELDELHNVDLTSNTPTNNQVLAYESATDLWKNKSLEELGSTINLISDGIPGTPVTGGTSFIRSLIKSYFIPANTFAAGDTFEVWAIGSKVNTNTAWYLSTNINTSNTIAGATEIGRSFSNSAAVTYMPFQRIFNFTTSTNLRGMVNNSGIPVESNQVGVSVSNTTFNTAVGNWFLFAIVPVTGGTADIMNIEKVIIRKNRYRITP